MSDGAGWMCFVGLLPRASGEVKTMFQDVIARLSAHFAELPPDQADEGIQEALEVVGQCLSAERVRLFAGCADGGHFERTHDWGVGDSEAPGRDAPSAVRLTLDDQPWLMERLGKFEVVSISKLSELPLGAASERLTLAREGVCSAIFAPMVARGTLVGFMKIESSQRERHWPRECHALLRVVLDLIVTSIERKSAHRALRERELRLQRRQRLEVMGRLAGGVAHDFNNFLTAILGYSDLLEAGLGDGDPGRAELREIRRAADRASMLIEQILSFGRQQAREARVVDLGCVVVELAKILRRVVGQDVELVLDLRDDLPDVLVDPGRVDQVLINLAVNARDAMPDGGTITISTDLAFIDEQGRTTEGRVSRVSPRPGAALKAGDYVVLTVRDNGSGMTAATRQRLFEPFFSTKASGRGTGLGLATVASIMEDSGGGIGVESELGKGSAFHLYFPVFRDAAAGVVASVSEAPDEFPCGNGETVLLVEPDRFMRDLLRRVLQDYGYQVLEAENADVALDHCAASRGPIHLLVTDIAMPRLFGCEIARQIEQVRPGIRVLFTSSYPEAALREDGVCPPDVRILEKPFTPRAFLRMVRERLAATTSEAGSLVRPED